jgi:methylenetetrahydrofolate dehydrogenase (NADP+)/methenyltetrahydrofolate cyclohydrolase
MPTKDVDCFHPENVGLVCQNKPRFVPCTPAGIIELLKRSSITVTGRQVTIINNSDIVGKPLAMMLTNMGATVGLCHHQSELDDIQRLCHASHIIIVAVGKPGFFTAEHMGRHGCTIIDVGISRISNKIVGDVDPNVYKIRPDAQYTPVPGGIGPMTVSMLLKNTIKAAWGQYR